MKMLINGTYEDAASGAVIEVLDPYTGKLLDTVPAAGAEDAERAVRAAREAFPGWSRTPVYDRAQLAHRFLELVDANREELAVCLSRESGKKISQSRNEVNNIILCWTRFIEKARHLYGTVIDEKLKAAIDATGYTCLGIESVPYEKKGLFGRR